MGERKQLRSWDYEGDYEGVHEGRWVWIWSRLVWGVQAAGGETLPVGLPSRLSSSPTYQELTIP